MTRVQEVAASIYRRSSMDRLNSHLEARYGIRVDGVQQLEGFVTRIDFDIGPSWVARVFPASRPLDAVEGDAEILRFLEQTGYPSERCARPDAVSMLDGQPVLVTEFIEGARAQGSPQTLRRLGEMLGQLQTLPRGPQSVRREAGSLHHWSPRGGGPGADLAEAALWLEEARDGLPSDQRPLFETLLQRVRSTDDLHDLPRAFVHPDFYPANAIAVPGGQLVLVDWAGAGTGPRIAPLAFLMWQSAVRNPHASGLEGVDAVVAGYQPYVRLDAEELARLPEALVKPPLVFDCFLFALGRKTLADTVAGLVATARTAEAIAERARAAFASGSSS